MPRVALRRRGRRGRKPRIAQPDEPLLVVGTPCVWGTHRGTHTVLTGYSQGTHRVLTGVLTGYSQGTHMGPALLNWTSLCSWYPRFICAAAAWAHPLPAHGTGPSSRAPPVKRTRRCYDTTVHPLMAPGRANGLTHSWHRAVPMGSPLTHGTGPCQWAHPSRSQVLRHDGAPARHERSGDAQPVRP